MQIIEKGLRQLIREELPSGMMIEITIGKRGARST
jgi:hypothetical protein